MVVFESSRYTHPNSISQSLKTLFLGFSSRDGSNQRPGIYWNPSERSARIQARTTNCQIWEVYGNSTLIT